LAQGTLTILAPNKSGGRKFSSRLPTSAWRGRKTVATTRGHADILGHLAPEDARDDTTSRRGLWALEAFSGVGS
jgi:hypothetical protein